MCSRVWGIRRRIGLEGVLRRHAHLGRLYASGVRLGYRTYGRQSIGVLCARGCGVSGVSGCGVWSVGCKVLGMERAVSVRCRVWKERYG